MDGCSAHDSKNTLQTLNTVEIKFFPPNMTSKLQPLDSEIVAAMKVRYTRRQMEHAVDLLNADVINFYGNGLLTAMRWSTAARKEIS